jgi:hypothetical protein
LSEVKSFSWILERLANNLAEGNTLVTFTRSTKFGEEYASLIRIDFENELIHLNSHNKKSTVPDLLLDCKNTDKS